MLVKYSPMNALLSPFFDDFWNPGRADVECNLVPRTDIIERKDSYVIYAEMPGVSKDDFKVEIENSLLTISGKKNVPEKADDEQLYRSERQCGNYRRSFRLGDEINTGKINAKYENGVLKVVLTKADKVKPKSIEVKIN